MNQIELCAAAEFQRRSELIGASFRAVAYVKGLEPPMPRLVFGDTWRLPSMEQALAAWMYYPEGGGWLR